MSYFELYNSVVKQFIQVEKLLLNMENGRIVRNCVHGADNCKKHHNNS